jgi:hypothetical protein
MTDRGSVGRDVRCPALHEWERARPRYRPPSAAFAALRLPRKDRLREITTTANHARAATARRWLSAAVLVASMAAGGGALASCGDDETPGGSEQAATNPPAQETQSGAEDATDPTGNTRDASPAMRASRS